MHKKSYIQTITHYIAFGKYFTNALEALEHEARILEEIIYEIKENNDPSEIKKLRSKERQLRQNAKNQKWHRDPDALPF